MRLNAAVFAAVLWLATTTTAGDNPAEAAAKPNDMSSGQAIRFDHTDMSLQALAAMLPPPRREAPRTVEVPNDFAVPRARSGSDLYEDPLAAGGLNPTASPEPGASFDGPTSFDNLDLTGFLVMPPDTNGDVGLQHVAMYVNLVWEVNNKSGTAPQGPFPGNAFWAGFGGVCETSNNGDPVVIYDHVAGRWLFTQFVSVRGVQCFAISDGEDPTGPGFTRYEFLLNSNGRIDYPKTGLWVNEDASQSAYTLTTRNFSEVFIYIGACLFDRDAMLAGDPAAQFDCNILPGGLFDFDGAQPGHIENGHVAPGGKCPLFSVAEAPDTYRFFEFCESFPGRGSFAVKPPVTVAAFDTLLGRVPQPAPGEPLDNLTFLTMYRASHANIDGEHRLAMAHTVDAGGDRAGMRWTLLDVNDYDAIAVIDQGTYAPNDGLERWMGSVTLDTVGNLGMGYSRGSAGSFPSVYMTGRETGDPAGTLQNEVRCVDGTGSQTAGSRWGDYSSTSLDPEDGCTFWTFQEYVEQTGSFEWNTRACSFSFASCTGIIVDEFTLLGADPGVAGQPNDWVTENGTTGAEHVVFFGEAGGTTPFPAPACGDITIDLGNARVLGVASADAEGSATVTRSVPAGAAGATFSFQGVDIGNCDKSNVTSTTFE